MTLLIQPVSGLYRAGYAKGRALSEIAGYEFGGLPPCDTTDKVSLLLRLAVCRMRLIAAIYRKCERYYRYTVLSCFKLGVAGKSSAQNSFVKIEVCHDSSLLYFRFCDRITPRPLRWRSPRQERPPRLRVLPRRLRRPQLRLQLCRRRDVPLSRQLPRRSLLPSNGELPRRC